MPRWIVTGTSMEVEADTEEEAIERAEQMSGWHWEAKQLPTEVQINARNLRVGDILEGQEIARVEKAWGTVFAWSVADLDKGAATFIYNHGDPIVVQRYEKGQS